MEPTSFDDANVSMDPPDGMDDCDTIRVQFGQLEGGMPVTVSCWKPTRDELDEIERTGRIWLTVGGHGMPPVILGAVKLI